MVGLMARTGKKDGGEEEWEGGRGRHLYHVNLRSSKGVLLVLCGGGDENLRRGVFMCICVCVCVCVCVVWAGKIWPGWFVDDKKLSFSSGLSLVMLDWHDESLQTGYRLPKHVESHLFFLAISVSIPCLCWYLVGTFLWVSFWLDYGTDRTDIFRYIHISTKDMHVILTHRGNIKKHGWYTI